ncbi:MAG: MFS transporter [Microthrixaceae bacterium]
MSNASRDRRLMAATGGASALPLIILFALNMVDELDQVTFGVVAPNIRDTFGTSEQAITSIAGITGAIVIMLAVPIGVLADRYNRVRMAGVAALAWAVMGVFTGISGFIGAIGLLVIARFGAGIGRLMNEPVHVGLLADYYPPQQHGRIFSIHRMANPIGGLFVLAGGVLADLVGWRFGFMLMAIPTVVAVMFLSRLSEPVRGASLDMGLAQSADEQAANIPISEGYRRLKAIPTLKRAWWAGALIGASIVPIAVFFNFFFENVYNVTSITARAAITMLYSVGQIFAFVWGYRKSTELLMAGETPLLGEYAGRLLILSGLALVVMASAPWIGVSIAFVFIVGLFGAFNSFALPLLVAVAPPRLRSQALGYFVFFIGLGGITGAVVVGGIGENQGYRYAINILSILLVIAGLIYRSTKTFIRRDADQAFKTLMVEAGLRGEQQGGVAGALLTCKDVEVAYDQVQVLFGVDLDIRPGECVALLGTNGAGKSTLLKAISGLVDPIGGAIFFDGTDITHTDGVGTAKAGIVQVPGGKAVFPTLTVAEHLRVAGWLYRDDPDYLKQANEEVLELFPRLRERIDQMAGNLSGGEQQMLALGMAFIAKPKLLMIDELSLGLAPTIVEQLLEIVRKIQATGTAIILVEQSINVALTVADRAYFMEKGEVRFQGSTVELLERDDIVRSVFLQGASMATGAGGTKVAAAATRKAPVELVPLLELTGVTKRFGGIRAVDDTSFTLHQGEILGLIGPNGAGKTTIFDLVSGFLIPDGGRIVLSGEDITEMAPDARAWMGLGRSFQDARLVPSLTVAENVAIGLERHLDVRDHVASALALPGVVRLEEDVAWTVDDLIEMMNLGAFRDKFVRELSTGSRRIVDLAMCIAHDPLVLLLDEPSSGIAQAETEALGPLLEQIQTETGCALLVIEHDMPLITSVSDRMIALELGHPIVEGTPEEVTTNARVVSSYLGGDLAVINRSGRVAPAAKPAAKRRAPLKAEELV